LKNKLSENEEQHKKSLQESLGKLEDSELTYRLLQEELARKENDIKDRDETIKELKSQLDSVSFDKERLLMVLENAHRDAITGEPIFADTNTWQQMRDEANEKIQYYSSMLDDLIGSLQLTNVQLEEQEKDLTTTAASSDQMFL
jgi:chromosome segregation ATPase